MPAFVCDASVAIAGVADDEKNAVCETLLERALMDGAAAPSLFVYEVANILTLKFGRKLISAEGRRRTLQSISDLNLDLAGVGFVEPAFAKILNLADAHRLTIYDAAYLELAMRLGVPLATLDGALAKAARSEGVTLLVT